MRPIDADVLVDMLQHLEDKLDKKAFHDVDFQAAYISGIVQEIKKRVIETPTINYVPRQQWISVEDRPPDTQHIMLVRTKNRNGVPKVAMASYHAGFGWCGSGGRWGNVTHWMPLPELPKEE